MARSLCALALALAPGHGVFAQKLGFAVAPPVGLPLYDCKAEYYMWETAWTPEWKAWCCAHENRGCPSTTTTTRTTTTVTTTSKTATSTSTETATETRTSTSTETATVTSTSTHTQTSSTRTSSTSTMTTTPWPTRTFTSTVTASTTETATETATTTVTATETTTTEAPTTTTTATTTTKDLHDLLAKLEKCDASCEFEGQMHTCSERIVFAAEHMFNKEANPCEAAHVLVLSQCAPCGYCTTQQACEEVQDDSMMVARLARKFLAQKSGHSAAAAAANVAEEALRPFRLALVCGAGAVALLAVLRAGFSWTGRREVPLNRRTFITENEAAFQE